MQSPKPNKSCDQCRHRKVRCIVSPTAPGEPITCTHCVKRNETCQFSNSKRRLRPKYPSSPQRSSDSESFKASSGLFIDRLIQNPSESAVLYDESSVLKAHDDRVSSSGIAFFSEKRVNSLVKRLGHADLRELVHQIDKTIRTRLLSRQDREISLYSLAKAPAHLEVDREAVIHIQRYFEVLHPVYPFLDRHSFEEKATSSELLHVLETDHSFCGLYYAILALGCQYNGYSSFFPDNNRAWKLFELSLSRLDRILMSPESLANLQALTAMAIFASNAFSHRLDQTLMSEAGRMVITLRYHNSILSEDSALCHRNFWVIYHLEKRYCFQARSSSVIADYDIGCPIPMAPESIIEGYNWLLSSVRFSRILSIAYSSLFSVSASTYPDDTLLASVNHVQTLLEDWRVSIPLEFRPKESLKRHRLHDGPYKEIALRTHYYYYHLAIALERLTLHVSRDITRSENSMRVLLNTASDIIELTRFIDVEPYTPVFILAIIPLSALFIIFDFVIHHPKDPEIHKYLTLLDIGAGHFSQLDHASNGAIPASHLSQFSYMARQCVQNEKKAASNGVLNQATNTQSSACQRTGPVENASHGEMDAMNDPTLMEGIDFGSLDGFYFLTPDSDMWMNGVPSLDEFDPREYYGSIFL